MRTTLTIDDFIMRELKEEAHRSGKPLKVVVNDVLREGLKQKKDPIPSTPYKCKSFSLGNPSRINLDKALGIADLLEDKENANKFKIKE